MLSDLRLQRQLSASAGQLGSIYGNTDCKYGAVLPGTRLGLPAYGPFPSSFSLRKRDDKT